MSITFRNIIKPLVISLALTSCTHNTYDLSDSVEMDKPKTTFIPTGRFMAGSEYAKSEACTNGVPPDGVSLGSESEEEYCERVGPHIWFLDEYPIRTVSLDTAFELSVTEITIGQFAAFVEETDYITTAEEIGETLGFDQRRRSSVITFTGVEGFTWKHPWPGADTIENLSDYPVVHVSREDALAYCDWLSRKTGSRWRLPTADEWDYAALGRQSGYPKSGTYAWGTELPDQKRLGNVSDMSFAQEFVNWKYPILSSHNDGFSLASPVATFSENGFGLFDMTGNVWEWTATTFEKTGEDGTSQSFPVMKGGAFDFEMPFQRVQKNRNLSYVYSQYKVSTSISVGFRIVRELNSDR